MIYVSRLSYSQNQATGTAVPWSVYIDKIKYHRWYLGMYRYPWLTATCTPDSDGGRLAYRLVQRGAADIVLL